MIASRNGNLFPDVSRAILLLFIVEQSPAGGSATIIHVDIACAYFMAPTSGPALAFSGPPIDVAVKDVNRRYAGVFNFTFTMVMEPEVVDCATVFAAMPRMVAEWLMRKRDPHGVPVIVAPGCLDITTVHQVTASLGSLIFQV